MREGGSILSIQLTSLLDLGPKIWKLLFIGVPLSNSHKTKDFTNFSTQNLFNGNDMVEVAQNVK